MIELLRPLALSLTALTLMSVPDTKVPTPKVETAVGFVNALIQQQSLDALFKLYPDLASEIYTTGSARLNTQQEDIWRWLHNSVSPLLQGCQIREGVSDNNTGVVVSFKELCGSTEVFPLESVTVELVANGPTYHPTGFLTFQGLNRK